MGVCSAKQKDPTQPSAPVPQPQQHFETPVKPTLPPPEPVTIHFHDNSSPPQEKEIVKQPPPPVVFTPAFAAGETESDLLADLRNQPSLEATEAEETRRREEAARLEQMRQEAEQARLQLEEERRALEAERRREEEARAQRAREEEAERFRLAQEEAARAEAAAAAEALRRQEEERARALAFVEEARAASRAEAQRQAEEEERAREEAARREAYERAEALRLEEEARQREIEEADFIRRREEEAIRAEQERIANEVAAERARGEAVEAERRAREEAEEAEVRAAENRLLEATAERKRGVRSRIQDLQQRTGVYTVKGLSNHELFFCELLWLEDFTGLKFDSDLGNLKSGQVLCTAANQVQPRSANYSDSVSLWKQRENILAFLGACEAFGLKKEALFLPQDLIEGQNMNNVTKTLDVFYKFVAKQDGFRGPYMAAPEDAVDENFKRSSLIQPSSARKSPSLKKHEFGMHADMRQRQNQKFEKEAPNIEKVSDWLRKVSGVEFKDFEDGLKSGVVLCKAMNKIQKNSIRKINNDDSKPFQQRENIENFISACRELGMKDQEIFEPNDLYEGKNLLAVAECLISLSRLLRNNKVAEFRGPYISELDKARTPAAWANNTLSDGRFEE